MQPFLLGAVSSSTELKDEKIFRHKKRFYKKQKRLRIELVNI